ncbi:protein kinase [Streptomyces sp. NPDC051105]|uniref:serine/threonine-protein kinase n=1 Tax=Streptomyces sp. NPDC051105 TaxID=3154843 RepID=UPI0034257FF9
MPGARKGAGRLIAGRYRLRRQLGRGGMGRVWLAYDQELACEVAIKEIALPPDVPEAEVSGRIARARGEARHAVRLRDHPHVITVHDIVEDSGLPWIVMAFVPGATDLEAVVRAHGPLPPHEVARIGLAVLDALWEGHRLGVLHRDVKPANILLTCPGSQPEQCTEGGKVLLTDYGIALEPGSGEPRLTTATGIIGTPRFLAPERVRGQDPTPASDLFGLGATLYFATEGTGPFDRPTDYASLAALLLEDPAPPRRAAGLTPVLLGLLAKDPARRMNADEAARQLSTVAAESHPQPAPQTTRQVRQPAPGHTAPSKGQAPEQPTPAADPHPAAATRTQPATTPARAEARDPAGRAPETRPETAEVSKPSPRPPRTRRRRAWLITGATIAVLAAAGGGIYLAQSRSTRPKQAAIAYSLDTIPVGEGPEGVAVSPDGLRLYVTNTAGNSVSVINTATNQAEGAPIPANHPEGVAVSPDGQQAYVAQPGGVSTIDTITNHTVGKTLPANGLLMGLTVSPDGQQAYVAAETSASMWVIDTATNRVTPIPLSSDTEGVAVSPDGSRVYATYVRSTSIAVIDTSTNGTAGGPIPLKWSSQAVAVSPDGHQAYATHYGHDSVSVIDTATNRTEGNPIPVGKGPAGVATSPDGNRVYVTNYKANAVSVIDTATNRTVGNPIPVGSQPKGIAVSPDGRQVYVTNVGSDSVTVITFS